MTRNEYIKLRIIELTAERDAMLQFVMNQKLRQMAGIIDKKIHALQAELDLQVIPGSPGDGIPPVVVRDPIPTDRDPVEGEIITRADDGRKEKD